MHVNSAFCFQGSKPEAASPDNEMKTENGDPSEVKENEAPEYSSDKKTDEVIGKSLLRVCVGGGGSGGLYYWNGWPLNLAGL
jgi:hypothetical protein